MEEKIFAIISKVLNVKIEDVNIESSPVSIEAWDSIAQINLIFAIEEEVGISFGDERIGELTSVKAILAAIKEIEG